MEEKIYEILGVKFKLRPALDLDMDESDEIDMLQQLLYSPSRNMLAVKFTSEEMRRYLEIVLIPVVIKPLPEGFSFRKAKGGTQFEVVKDFFLAALKAGLKSVNDFAGSMEQQLKQSNN
jgi:hypothetical protein